MNSYDHLGNRLRDAAPSTALLGRLGSELALVYHDTLHASLPAGLQALVDRLDAAMASAAQDQGGAGDPGVR